MRLEKKGPVFNAEMLKDLRIKKGLTVYNLCVISGIDESQLHRMEKGKVIRPTFDTIAALALSLEVSTDIFINKMNL